MHSIYVLTEGVQWRTAAMGHPSRLHKKTGCPLGGTRLGV